VFRNYIVIFSLAAMISLNLPSSFYSCKLPSFGLLIPELSIYTPILLPNY